MLCSPWVVVGVLVVSAGVAAVYSLSGEDASALDGAPPFDDKPASPVALFETT